MLLALCPLPLVPAPRPCPLPSAPFPPVSPRASPLTRQCFVPGLLKIRIRTLCSCPPESVPNTLPDAPKRSGAEPCQFSDPSMDFFTDVERVSPPTDISHWHLAMVSGRDAFWA